MTASPAILIKEKRNYTHKYAEHTKNEVQEIVFSEMRNNNPKYYCDSIKMQENQGDMPFGTVKRKCLKKNSSVHIWGEERLLWKKQGKFKGK